MYRRKTPSPVWSFGKFDWFWSMFGWWKFKLEEDPSPYVSANYLDCARPVCLLVVCSLIHLCIQHKKQIQKWHTDLKPCQCVVLLSLVPFALPVLFWRFYLPVDFCSSWCSLPDWLMCFTCDLSSCPLGPLLPVSVDYLFLLLFSKCCSSCRYTTLGEYTPLLCIILRIYWQKQNKREPHSKW